MKKVMFSSFNFNLVFVFCIQFFPLQEVVENVETVASPETSGEEEGEFSCSDDVDSCCVLSVL